MFGIVTGLYRSSTTGVARGIRSVKGAYTFPYETNFLDLLDYYAYFRRFVNRFGGLSEVIGREIQFIRHRIDNDPDRSERDYIFLEDYEGMWKEIVNSHGSLPIADVANLVSRFFQKGLHSSGSALLVEKSPNHTLYLKYLSIFIPDFRVVFCIRDPLQVVLSALYRARNDTNAYERTFVDDELFELSRVYAYLVASKLLFEGSNKFIIIASESLRASPTSGFSSLACLLGLDQNYDNFSRFREIVGGSLDEKNREYEKITWMAQTLAGMAGYFGYTYPLVEIPEAYQEAPHVLYGAYKTKNHIWLERRFVVAVLYSGNNRKVKLTLALDSTRHNISSVIKCFRGFDEALFEVNVKQDSVDIEVFLPDCRDKRIHMLMFEIDTFVARILSGVVTNDNRRIFNILTDIVLM
jgi:hypothetical protein